MVDGIVEVEVLSATVVWLLKNSWTIDSISFPKGQDISLEDQPRFFKEYLEENSVTINSDVIFNFNGPDIIATQQGVKWKIECKGHSNGQPQTRRNNFDRALASCVTYYDNSNLKLGLALPDSYLFDIKKRVPTALRQALKMSILLFNTSTNKIDYYSPDYIF